MESQGDTRESREAPHLIARRHIVFIGEYLFPGGDAAAIRTMSLARICRDLGFQVTVIGKGQLRPDDYCARRDGYYVEGIAYRTMNPEPMTAARRLRHPLQRLRLYVSALDSLGLDDVKAVIIYASGSAVHVPSVQTLCRRRAVPLVGDICEWYDPRQFPYARLNPSYHIFQAAFRYAFPRLRNAIVVSNFLRAHFERDGRNVITVPPVLDTTAIPHVDRTPADRLVLMYAGMPGRKDLLASLLVALAELADEQHARIEFRLLGPTEDELRRILGGSAAVLGRLGNSVKALGRVPHERVLAELQQAHFTVLLRPNKRYANAGFPSKVPESLAAGTPILLNLTSDLREYLGDFRGALTVPECSPATLTAALTRALRLSSAELKELRSQAREKAERHFDYRQYLQPFAHFLQQLQ